MAPRRPSPHRAVWADKATHVLHDADHPQPRLPTEGQLPPHVPHGHCLATREEVAQADGHPEQGEVPARVGQQPGKRDGAPQYLGRGDQEGAQGAAGAQGVHRGHVLIRGPRGRVHNQVVQLSPGHIRHKLLYQRCKDPGRSEGRGLRRRLLKPTASTRPPGHSVSAEPVTPRARGLHAAPHPEWGEHSAAGRPSHPSPTSTPFFPAVGHVTLQDFCPRWRTAGAVTLL